jgi:hypothetical protein
VDVMSRLVAALLLAGCFAACGVTPVGRLPDRPDNANAVEPISVVAQGSGAGGEFRVWAYRTSDAMSCIEVGSTRGSSSACDPTGRPPIGSSGVSRNNQGVVVWAATGAISAITAVIHDEEGPDTSAPLILGGPSLPGVKLAIADLDAAAKPFAIDFLDATGAKVDSIPLR